MPSPSADNSFHKGMAALKAGDTLEALAYFEAAVLRDRQINPQRPTMRYLSYYGLALGLATGRREEAIRLCKQAAGAEFYNPELLLNLGRVALDAGDRRTAFDAFRQGLALHDGHPELRSQIRRLGIRRRPLFGFLKRNHPVNRLAGQLRLRLRGEAAR